MNSGRGIVDHLLSLHFIGYMALLEDGRGEDGRGEDGKGGRMGGGDKEKLAFTVSLTKPITHYNHHTLQN